MKLYGMPVAILPRKDSPEDFNVICNPIAVSRNSKEKFELLGDLASTRTFNFNDVPSIIDCFVNIVRTLKSVVKLQEESFDEANKKNRIKIPYRPVAIEIGQATNTPISLNALSIILFGENFFIPQTDEELRKELPDIVEDFLVNMRGTKYETMPRADLDRFAYNQLSRRNKKFDEDAERAKALRTEFLEKQQYPDEFFAACWELSRLIKKCVLDRGSYTEYGDEKKKVEDTKASLLDKYLRSLKSGLRYDREEGLSFDCHYELIDEAKEIGRQWGTIITRTPDIFFLMGPEGLRNDKDAQDKLASYSFFHWHEAYKKAFNEGFQETYLGTHNKIMKLPLDPDMPPFSTTVHFAILDQIDVINGRRDAEHGIKDEPGPRRKIIELTTNVLTKAGKTDHGSWKGFIKETSDVQSHRNHE